MTIIFTGLIAHVLTAGGIQRAVLVAAPNHAARLIVKSSDIVSESQPSLRDDSGAPAGERWFNIAGLTMKFGGLPAGTPVVDSSFAEHVVPLSLISDATEIRPEIESGRLFSGAAAYVDLPAGVLRASDLYPEQVTFESSRWSVPRCLAQHVLFTAARGDADQIQVRTNSGATLTLRVGAVLRVENEPIGTMAPHFQLYQQLLVGAQAFGTPVSTGRGCDGTEVTNKPTPAIGPNAARLLRTSAAIRGHPLPRDLGQVDCSNTRWP